MPPPSGPHTGGSICAREAGGPALQGEELGEAGGRQRASLGPGRRSERPLHRAAGGGKGGGQSRSLHSSLRPIARALGSRGRRCSYVGTADRRAGRKGGCVEPTLRGAHPDGEPARAPGTLSRKCKRVGLRALRGSAAARLDKQRSPVSPLWVFCGHRFLCFPGGLGAH